MAENDIPNVKFKRFMANNTQANLNVVRMIYKNGDPSLPMVACERTCLLYWSASLDKVTQ